MPYGGIKISCNVRKAWQIHINRKWSNGGKKPEYKYCKNFLLSFH